MAEKDWKITIVMPFDDDWTESMVREHVVSQLDSGEYLPKCDVKTVRPVDGMRRCEKCRGPGPCLWDDQVQRYLGRCCHSNPNDLFFRSMSGAPAKEER